MCAFVRWCVHENLRSRVRMSERASARARACVRACVRLPVKNRTEPFKLQCMREEPRVRAVEIRHGRDRDRNAQ
eukprot:2465013-Pleurochrysis_carterae.AAC.1